MREGSIPATSTIAEKHDDGSVVVGWYNLPQPQSYYIPNGNPDYRPAGRGREARALALVLQPRLAGHVTFTGGSSGVPRLAP